MSRHLIITCCVLLALIVGKGEPKVSALEQQQQLATALPDQQLSEQVEMPLKTLDANILRCKRKQRHQKKHCNNAVHKTRTHDNKSKKRQVHKKTHYSNVRLSGALKSSTVSADAHNMDDYSPGTLTHQKLEQLGNSKAVSNARRSYEKSHADEAKAHWHRVMNSKCHEPQQRCVRIDSHPSKIYAPHCTILHRCAEDSGCCHDRTEICAPKKTQDVELPFIVKTSQNHHTIIELLTFVNHTECHCIQRGTYATESVNPNLGVRQATILNCNCPQYFEKILQNDGQCRCDCSSSNYDCEFRKNGSEHFSMSDRKCIQRGYCKPPTCQFGRYMEKQGRCPKENDQMHYQPNPYNPRSLS